MANNFIKRYTWLVELLLNEDGATFETIAEFWKEEEFLNPEGEKLSRSSFNKQLKAIPRVLNINIVRSKDHKYRVDNYHGQLDHLLYNNVSLNALLDRDKRLLGRILFEDEPRVNMRWLEDIAHSMSEEKQIAIDYHKYGDEFTTRRTVSPYCLKMYKRRWYLLAQDGGEVKTFALDDRLRDIKILDESFAFPEDFDAAAHFKNAYGVTIGKESQEILIKTYGNESLYWRSAPFHPSQKEIKTGDDYAIFSFYMYPDTPELIHALLSHGASIEVLEPSSLRDTLKGKIDEMVKRYA